MILQLGALFLGLTCAIALIIACCLCTVDCLSRCCYGVGTIQGYEDSDETSEDSSESSENSSESTEEFEVTFRGISPDTKDFPATSAATACIICLENEKIIACQPCGHIVFCYGCLKLQPKTPATTKCPMCRKRAMRFQRMFS